MGVWDPTGSQIAYSSARKGNLEAWVESSDGSGAPRQLTSLGGQVHVDSWSADGRTLTLHHHPPQGPVNIYMLAMDGVDAKPEAFFPGESSKESAEFSRDRQYVSYLSAETGQREIYIRPYQKSGPARHGVSRRGARAGVGPQWRPVLSQPQRREDVFGIRQDVADAECRYTRAGFPGTVLRPTDGFASRAI